VDSASERNAPTALDRLIGRISPRWGLARYHDRLRLTRAYEAAAPGDSWRPRRAGASANTDHRADAAIIRSKARSLVQNVPYIAAALRGLVAHTVGTGIVSYPKTANDTLSTLYARWCAECDADGQRDWHGIQAAAYRTMEQDGEVLLRLRPRLSTDGLAVPLQVQLLEIDWLDGSKGVTPGSLAGVAEGNMVVNGIEYDRLGKVAAYWLYEEHPGELQVRRTLRTLSRRVDARWIIHLFAPDRPGQGRGFSRFAPVISRARDLALYEDAELARKNLESRLGVLLSGDASLLGNDNGGAPSEAGGSAKDLGQLPSGGMMQVPAGVNITTVAPNPAPGYVDTVKMQLHLIAAGIGVPIELMTGDSREAGSFSSVRARRQEFRLEVEAMQWLTLVPRLCDTVWRAFVQAAIDSGKLRPGSYPADHSTPKWEYVNPQQDAEAEIRLISCGLLTISESLRRRGYKPAEVFKEYQQDMDQLKAAGLLPILLTMLKGGNAAPSAAAAMADMND
jgi:lambda family phage portal protein